MMGEKLKSRRVFLKKSSAALAGTALAAGLSVGRSAHAAGSDTLKFALIGCGGRGMGAAAQAMDASAGVKLWAMADVFQNKADAAYKNLTKGQEGRYDRSAHKGFAGQIEVPAERRYVGFDAYKQAIGCGVDFVILATPPGFRPAQYKAAIEARKHVFMEKPCCVDAPGFRTLREANKLADKEGLKVGVGLQRHHHAQYVEAVKRLQDGAVGDIGFMRIYWNSPGIWTVKRRPGWSDMEYQIRNWNVFTWLSGDHLVEQHTHNIDVANWIKEAHPVEANGMGGRQVRKGKDNGQIFDHHAIEFTYADGTKLFSQCRQIPGCWNYVGEFAHGTKGLANLSYNRAKIDGENKWRYRGKSTNAYDQEHIDLQAAIRNNTPMNEGWFGATSTMTGILGRMATYSGKVVKWDDAVAKGPNELPAHLAMDAPTPVTPDTNDLYEHAVAVPGVYKPFS